MTSCPICIAAQRLRELEALDRGEDLPSLFPRKPKGQKLDHASQAGFAREALREVTRAGAFCGEHQWPPR